MLGQSSTLLILYLEIQINPQTYVLTLMVNLYFCGNRNEVKPILKGRSSPDKTSELCC